MIKSRGKEAFENWGSLSLYTYVLLSKGADPVQVEKRLPEMYLQYMEDLSKLENITFEPYLQPLTKIHLHSNLMAEIETNSDIKYVYTFLAIALFILLIACINFMNLSTARSIKRAREVGMRKVVGGYRTQLISQFIGESLILSFIGLVFSLILVEISLPTFNQLLDKELSLQLFRNVNMFLLLIGLAIVVGFIAGSYPAFYLSAFQPIKVLKGTFSEGAKKSPVRNILVIIQFTISIFLIICTGFVFNQLIYLQEKKLGFNHEKMIIIPLRGDRIREKATVFKSEFSNLSFVSAVSTSRFVPGRDMDGSGYVPEGYDENNPVIIFTNVVDHDYIRTMEMTIVEGREFSREFATDSNAVIINETLAKRLEWDQPLGKKITGFGNSGEFDLHVVGVVKDFHFRSLHDVVEPGLMFISSNHPRNLNIRLQQGNIHEQMNILREKWEEIEFSIPFDYYFLDEDFNRQYKAEQRIGEIFIYFTIIAIVIACLGLFGLASYNAEQKTKEIGIRKALGSSVQRIVFMLSKQFTKWVLIANIIAWPLAWYFMSDWLSNFAYRIDILSYWWIFILAGLLAIIIAIITVVYQAIKAAITSPVDAIKYE
jgi:putative ABC transport system permease protein